MSNDLSRFNDEQKRVINENTSNIIISAGAGSGKTSVLTERVIHLLKDKNYKLKEMIILTFTDLAAKEMKDRIIEGLKDEPMLEEELLHIDEAAIQTFDSFCHDFVVKYSAYSKISPSFQIGDSALFEMIVEREIKDILKEEFISKNPKFINLLNALDVKSPLKIENHFKSLYFRIIEDKNFEDLFYDYEERFYGELKKKRVKEEIKSFIKDRIKFINSLNLKPLTLKLDEYVSNIRSTLDFIYNLNDVDQMILRLNSFELSKRPNISYKDDLVEEEKIKAAYDGLRNTISTLKSFSEIIQDKIDVELNKFKDESLYYIKLIKELHERVELYKSSHKVYSFIDIQKEAIRILKNNYDIKEEYRFKIKEILVDESQDTNDINVELLNLLSNGSNLVMVGDIKQTIYQFRNANPTLFSNRIKDYQDNNNGKVIELDYNYRSRKEEVLDISNMIFENISKEDYLDISYLNHKLKFGFSPYLEENSKENEFKIYTLNKETINNQYKYVCEDIKRRILNKERIYDKKTHQFREIRLGDFLILAFKNKYLKLIQEELIKYNMPSKAYAVKSFTTTEEVKFLKNTLRVIDYMDKGEIESSAFSGALLSVLRSFVLNVNDDIICNYLLESRNTNNEEAFKKVFPSLYETFNKFILLLHKKNAYYVLKEIITEFNVYTKLMQLSNYEEREVKINILLSKIKTLSNIGMRLRDIIDYFTYLKNNEIDIDIKQNDLDDLDYISILTIHKSKGLEKPVVYITDLFQGNRKSKPIFKSEYGIYFNCEKRIIDRLSFEKENKDIKIEHLRVLYVALTRARESLVLIFNEDVKKKYSELNYLSSFQELLMVNNDYEKYYKNIEITDEGLKNGYIPKEKVDIVYLTLKDFKKEEIVKEKASHDLYKIDDEILKSVETGTILHSYFEKVNFLNNDFEYEIKRFNIDEDVKKYLYNFKNQEIFNTVSIREFHELPFYEDNISGVIDYILEKENEFLIIDFKMKKIEDIGYIKQLHTYKNYLKNRTKKEVKTYLYSIINNELRLIE